MWSTGWLHLDWTSQLAHTVARKRSDFLRGGEETRRHLNSLTFVYSAKIIKTPKNSTFDWLSILNGWLQVPVRIRSLLRKGRVVTPGKRAYGSLNLVTHRLFHQESAICCEDPGNQESFLRGGARFHLRLLRPRWWVLIWIPVCGSS